MSSPPDPLLRVGLNLLWLRPGDVGGTETYALRVIRSVVEHRFDEVAFESFAPPRALARHGLLSTHTTARRAPVGSGHPISRVLVERTWLRSAIRAAEPDIVHHLGGTVPVTGGRPTLVTVHDLQPLADPQNFPILKRRWLARALPAAIARAHVIVTPSDWVGATVRDRFGVDESRVVTVSAHAHRIDRPPIDVEPSGPVAELVGQGPLVLHPAMTMAHKNHRMLFRAFTAAASTRPDLRLVCVGSIGPDDASIRAAARDASPRIHMLGRVSGADLDALMAAAELVVVPSRYEGFGLPVLEAQQAGTPVAVSTAAALPEVAGAGALLLDPDDVDAWADAMSHPLTDARRRELVDAGRSNVERYTPAATARAQVAAYRLTAEHGTEA